MAFSSAAEAKINHWFSRRHQSSEAHVACRERTQARLNEKFEGAQQRAYEARNRKPEEQLARLDSRFGKGIGAVRERARLARKIEAARAPKKPAVEKPKTQKGESPKKAQKRGERRERQTR